MLDMYLLSPWGSASGYPGSSSDNRRLGPRHSGRLHRTPRGRAGRQSTAACPSGSHPPGNMAKNAYQYTNTLLHQYIMPLLLDKNSIQKDRSTSTYDYVQFSFLTNLYPAE